MRIREERGTEGLGASVGARDLDDQLAGHISRETTYSRYYAHLKSALNVPS